MPARLNISLTRRALAATAAVTIIVMARPVPPTPNPSLLDPRDMARGVTMTQAQCAALPTAVWVRVTERDFCIRYYVSAAGGDGNRPVVFMQGDKGWKQDRRARTFILPPEIRPFDPAGFTRQADSFSRASGTTGIYLARMGIDGSSGHHLDRHTVLELQVMNAALTAIRRRHGFDGFHLVGQSGGASLVGGLLGLRTDIHCAVPGAGRLARLNTYRDNPDPSLRTFDAMAGIAHIVRRSKARILVVTDPQDTRVPYRHQIAFVDELRRAGRPVEHYFIEATDERHHGTVAYTRPAVAACVRGDSQLQISAELAAVVAQRLAVRAKRLERQNAGTQPAAPRRTQPANLPAAQLQGL